MALAFASLTVGILQGLDSSVSLSAHCRPEETLLTQQILQQVLQFGLLSFETSPICPSDDLRGVQQRHAAL